MAPPSTRPANQYDDQWLLVTYTDKGQNPREKRGRAATKELSPAEREKKRKQYDSWRANLQAKGGEASKLNFSTDQESLGSKKTNDQANKRPNGKHTPSDLYRKKFSTKRLNSRKPKTDKGLNLPIRSANLSRIQNTSSTIPRISTASTTSGTPKSLSTSREPQGSRSKLEIVTAFNKTVSSDPHDFVSHNTSNDNLLVKSLIGSAYRKEGSQQLFNMEFVRHNISSFRRKTPEHTSENVTINPTSDTNQSNHSQLPPKSVQNTKDIQPSRLLPSSTFADANNETPPQTPLDKPFHSRDFSASLSQSSQRKESDDGQHNSPHGSVIVRKAPQQAILSNPLRYKASAISDTPSSQAFQHAKPSNLLHSSASRRTAVSRPPAASYSISQNGAERANPDPSPGRAQHARPEQRKIRTEHSAEIPAARTTVKSIPGNSRRIGANRTDPMFVLPESPSVKSRTDNSASIRSFDTRSTPRNPGVGPTIEVKDEFAPKSTSKTQLATGPGSRFANAIDLTQGSDDELDSSFNFDFFGSTRSNLGRGNPHGIRREKITAERKVNTDRAKHNQSVVANAITQKTSGLEKRVENKKSEVEDKTKQQELRRARERIKTMVHEKRVQAKRDAKGSEKYQEQIAQHEQERKREPAPGTQRQPPAPLALPLAPPLQNREPASSPHKPDSALAGQFKGAMKDHISPSTKRASEGRPSDADTHVPPFKRPKLNVQHERSFAHVSKAEMDRLPKEGVERGPFQQEGSDSEENSGHQGVAGSHSDGRGPEKGRIEGPPEIKRGTLHVVDLREDSKKQAGPHDRDGEMDLRVTNRDLCAKKKSNVQEELPDLRALAMQDEVDDSMETSTHEPDDSQKAGSNLGEPSTNTQSPRTTNATEQRIADPEPTTQPPDRADGLGNISYYPRFPGAKTANRDLFKPKEARSLASNVSSPNAAAKKSGVDTRVNEISATGWEIARGIIPKECFSAVDRAKETVEAIKKPSFFLDQNEDEVNKEIDEAFQKRGEAQKEKERAQAERTVYKNEPPKLGLSDESVAQWRRKFEREAEDLQERRILKEQREKGQFERQKRLMEQRERRQRLEDERTRSDTSTPLVSAEQNVAKTAKQPPDFSPFAYVQPPIGSKAEPAALQERAEALFWWRQAGLKWEEIERKWNHMTGDGRKRQALRDYYFRLEDSIKGSPTIREHKGKITPTSQRIPPNRPVRVDHHVKAKKKVRFDETAWIREYDANGNNNDIDIDLPQGVNVLDPARESMSPNFGGGKDMKLVKKWYEERQRIDYSVPESDTEEETPEVTSAREESPITEADLTYWTYAVKRKEWNDEEDEEDVPWIQCGDVYNSLYNANLAAGKEILQQRDAPYPLFPDPEEFNVRKDANDLKQYHVVLSDYNVKVKVSRALRTSRDGVPPKSKTGWLHKILYEIKYQTGKTPNAGEEEVKVVPELFTIREQANQNAAKKLVDLSVEMESQRIDEIEKRIEIEAQVDKYLAALEGERDLFDAEGDDGTGVKVWVVERGIEGPRNM